MHVVLHVYPVTRSLASALIVCEAVVAAELHDDRIQVEEALTIYNLGRTAWQPDEVHMALPEGFTAFNSQTQMSDQGVDQAGALRASSAARSRRAAMVCSSGGSSRGPATRTSTSTWGFPRTSRSRAS